MISSELRSDLEHYPLVFWFSDLPLLAADFCSEFRTTVTFYSYPQPFEVAFAALPSTPLRALLLLLLMTNRGVIEYLLWAKDQEQDKWLADDIAIAIRTCVLADQGVEHPDIVASYEVLGLAPSEVWPQIVARRKAVLGSLYDAWCVASGEYRSSACADADGAAAIPVNSSLPPRKSVQSEILPQKAKGKAA